MPTATTAHRSAVSPHAWHQVDPSERKIMLTEAPMNPVSNRVRMTEMMFEKYGFAGAHIDIQALLVLYSQGASRGVSALAPPALPAPLWPDVASSACQC